MFRCSEQTRRFRRPGPPLAPRCPELLPVPPYDRSGRLQTNADGAALIDEGTFGDDPPDDILGGQYRRHPTITRDAAPPARKRLSAAARHAAANSSSARSALALP